MTDNQLEAIAHLDKERLRYGRMAQRLRTIQMPLLASTCDEISRLLKSGLDIQVRVLNRPEQYLKFSPGPSDNHKQST